MTFLIKRKNQLAEHCPRELNISIIPLLDVFIIARFSMCILQILFLSISFFSIAFLSFIFHLQCLSILISPANSQTRQLHGPNDDSQERLAATECSWLSALLSYYRS